MSATDELIQLIEEMSGIVIPARDRSSLERLAVACAQATADGDIERYVRSLRTNLDGGDWQRLLGRITVKESYLFRAPQQVRALAETVIPELEIRRASSRRLRAWCAGCARGEEAATVATVLAEARLVGWDWRILATDVDEAALAEAARGVYGRRAVAQVPPPLLARYFTPHGPRFELSQGLRSRIDYRPLNLINLPLPVPEAPFDVVLLRNVLIYFRPEQQRRVVEAVAATLASDGFLFLGPAESLWPLFSDLTAVDLGDCFCYRWPTAPAVLSMVGGAPAAPSPGPAVTEAPSPAPVAPAVPAASPGRDADEPVAAPGPAEVGPVPRPAEGPRLEAILELLAAGRLAEARRLIRHEARNFPDNAPLRAFEGLAADIDDDGEWATRSYRAALYLDPRLYQVRFLLARALERSGWPDRARRAYREALAGIEAPGANDLLGADRLGLPSQRQVADGCRRALNRPHRRSTD